MTPNRRTVLGVIGRLGGIAGLAALPAVAAPPARAADAETIDGRVNSALQRLFKQYPESKDLAARAHGILVMPDVTKGGFIVGGAYGEGALRVSDSPGKFTRTVDYYSVGSVSVGLQFGGQETSHALFFMTEDAMEKFRRTDGWEAGADAEVTFPPAGKNLGASSTTVLNKPVIGFVFGQSGVMVGASLKGSKYSRITP